MSKLSFSLLAIAILIAFSFTVLKENAVTTYKVDPASSTLKWTGKKVTGEHTGNIRVSGGSLQIEGKNIQSGNFDIDVNSITCTDIADKTSNEKLVGHLKGDDFFATARYPKASFVITNAVSKGNDQYDITGNLTIKGITNSVQFPATVKVEGSKVTAKAVATVNRTKYDIKFKSASFFENLGDKAIYDDFTLDFNLVAAK